MQSGTEIKSRRGRPPSYDREQAIRAIVETFRRQGFAATSLADLSAATGMNRPSLDLAFGSKRQMYLTALEHFRHDIADTLNVSTRNPAALPEAITKFFDAAIRFYCAGDSRGCLVLCTATTEAAVDDEIRAALTGVITEIENQIRGLINRAVSAGAHVSDATTLSQLLSAVFVSIAIQSRAGLPPSRLKAFARGCVNAALTAE